MYKEIIDKIKSELDKVINFLEKELFKIRTSRATPTLVEDIIVKCFDQTFPLKQLGAISCSGPREIIIQPWDKSYIEPIERAISQAGIGVNPVVDKNLIRLTLPSLSEEYRKNLLKVLSQIVEGARRSVRHWREEAWKEIQESFKQGKISEDDKFRAKDELQELIDEYNEKIANLAEKKKKEVEQ